MSFWIGLLYNPNDYVLSHLKLLESTMNNTVVQLSDANIYQGEHLVLQSVNMNLVKGEFTYLIGKTGSGKSSLLKTLYAALDQ